MPVFVPYFECVARFFTPTDTAVFGFIWRACLLNGHECYYTKDNIATALGVSKKTVIVSIQSLTDKKLVIETKHSGGNAANHYKVNYDLFEMMKNRPPRCKIATVKKVHGNGEESTPLTVKILHGNGVDITLDNIIKDESKEIIKEDNIADKSAQQISDAPTNPERRIKKPKSTQPDAFILEDDPINPEVHKKPSKPPVPHKVLCKVFQDVAQSIPAGALGKNVKNFIETYGVTKENVEDIANVLRDFYTPETGTWETVELGWNSAGCFHHSRPTPAQIVKDFGQVMDFSVDGDEYAELQDAINDNMSPKGDIGRGLAKNFYNHFKKYVSSPNELAGRVEGTFIGDAWLQRRFADGTGGETENRDYWLVYRTMEHVFKELNQTPAW